METHKKIPALGALFTALVFAGCFQESITSQPDNALATGAKDPNIAMLVAAGLSEANISLTVDPDHDTAYVYEKPLTATEQKKGYATIRYAYRKKSLDAARLFAAASAEERAELAAIAERSAGVQTMIPKPIDLKMPSWTTRQAPLSKSAQTRYDHGNSVWDVKALTEVYNIKVYITQTGGFKLGAGWLAGAREAIAKWNAVTGTHVSFVETNDINDCDLILKSAYASSGGATVWMTPDHLVEASTTANGMSGVEIYFNAGFETVFPHNQKVGMAMVSLGNMVNIYHTNMEGYDWEGGTMANIAGTPSSDGASLFQTPMGPSVNPVFSAWDLKAIRQLYPLNGSSAIDNSNTLWIAGWESNIQIATNVSEFQQIGDTLLWLSNGSLQMRVGTNNYNQSYYGSGNAASFKASSSHVVIEHVNGHFLYRPLSGGSWQTRSVPSGTQYRLYGNQLIYLTYNSSGAATLHAFNLSTNAYTVEWVGPAGLPVDDFQIQGNQLFYAVGSSVWEKTIGVSNSTIIHHGIYNNPASRIQVSASHIAIHVWVDGTDGTIYTRPLSGGSWSFAWNEAFNNEHFHLCGDKIAVIGQGYYLMLRDIPTGSLYYPWDGQVNGAAYTVRLSGPMCDYVTKIDQFSGAVMTKYGITSNTDYLQYAWGGKLWQRQ